MISAHRFSHISLCTQTAQVRMYCSQGDSLMGIRPDGPKDVQVNFPGAKAAYERGFALDGSDRECEVGMKVML